MRLVLIGLVAGVFSALFGVGGGIVVVPLLILLAHFPAKEATTASLGAILITAITGVAAYALRGEVHVGYAALVGIPATAGVIAGTTLQQRVPARELALLFAGLIVAIAVWLIAS